VGTGRGAGRGGGGGIWRPWLWAVGGRADTGCWGVWGVGLAGWWVGHELSGGVGVKSACGR